MHAESSATASARSSTTIRRYRPYYTPAEVRALTYKQRGKLSASREERNRQTACDFIQRTGAQLGFPRRVTATAQLLYHRFHLFFPLKDFQYQEVCLSALYVSSKLHDTLKKPRDIILASYSLRYPDLARGQALVTAASVDPQKLESERRRVLSIERLILETICFNFKVGDRSAFRYTVKIGKDLKLSKSFCHLAWLVTADVHRTLSPLQYPIQSVCLAAYYTLALLLLGPDDAAPAANASDVEGQNSTDATVEVLARRFVDTLGQAGSWEGRYSSLTSEVVEIVHSLLDLYVTAATAPAGDLYGPALPSPMSPAERISDMASNPARSSRTSRAVNTDYKPSPRWNAQTLTQLKIRLREESSAGAAPARLPIGDGSEADVLSHLVDVGEAVAQRGRQIATGRNVGEVWGAVIAGLGSNDGTIRFLAT